MGLNSLYPWKKGVNVTAQRIFVAGHKGMVGSAICRRLARYPTVELVTAERADLNLVDQAQVRAFFCA
jgi:GDP-L-fucose synthase